MLLYDIFLEKLRIQKSPQKSEKVHFKDPKLNALHSAFAGALAGSISWVPVIQFDVAKVRMMAELDPNRYRNLWHCLSVVAAVRNREREKDRQKNLS